jgi:hypothetical protein
LTRSLLASLAAIAVLVTACGADTNPAPSGAPTATSAEVASPAPAGKPVPVQLQFTAKTIDGQEFGGESLLGGL